MKYEISVLFTTQTSKSIIEETDLLNIDTAIKGGIHYGRK